MTGTASSPVQLIYAHKEICWGLMNGQTIQAVRLPLAGGVHARYIVGQNLFTDYQHPSWLGTSRLVSDAPSRSVTHDVGFAPFGEQDASTNLRNEITSIRIQDFRMRGLLEVLLHAGTTLGGWSTKEIHRAVLDRFSLTVAQYNLNSLRTILGSSKGTACSTANPNNTATGSPKKGQRTAILFLLFHQRLCGPLAGSQFEHRPNACFQPQADRLERAYHKSDQAIDNIVRLLRAGCSTLPKCSSIFVYKSKRYSLLTLHLRARPPGRGSS